MLRPCLEGGTTRFMGQSLPQFLLGWTRPLQGLFQDETFLLTVTAHPFQHHKTRCQVGWITKCETDPCLRAQAAHFVVHLANPGSSAWTRNRGRLYIRESKEEGRMSRLQLRTRSGKVVLERAEGVASCLGEQLTSCAEGVQRLISAPHEIR